MLVSVNLPWVIFLDMNFNLFDSLHCLKDKTLSNTSCFAPVIFFLGNILLALVLKTALLNKFVNLFFIKYSFNAVHKTTSNLGRLGYCLGGRNGIINVYDIPSGFQQNHSDLNTPLVDKELFYHKFCWCSTRTSNRRKHFYALRF